jgi:hypothetical protein
MLDLDEFVIQVLTFELRFENAYLLWDRAGEMASRFIDHDPAIRFVTAQPHQQIFETDDLHIVSELASLRVSSRGPNALKQLMDFGEVLALTTREVLRINTFTRVGFRNISRKVFPDRKTAVQTLSHVSESFGETTDDWERVGMHLSDRLESESRGFSATIKVEQQEVNLTIPWEASNRIDFKKQKEAVGILDSDYYTIGSVDHDAFNAETWIKFANRTVNQYWESRL